MWCSYVKFSQQKHSEINVCVTDNYINAIQRLNKMFSVLKALVLVYDYYPGSQTLLSKYFTPGSDANGYQDPFQGEARPFRYEL